MLINTRPVNMRLCIISFFQHIDSMGQDLQNNDKMMAADAELDFLQRTRSNFHHPRHEMDTLGLTLEQVDYFTILLFHKVLFYSDSREV